MDRITKIAGKLNNGSIFYWKLNANIIVQPGDYTIVENLNGYTLVKDVGIINTNTNEVKEFSSKPLKNVVKVIYDL